MPSPLLHRSWGEAVQRRATLEKIRRIVACLAAGHSALSTLLAFPFRFLAVFTRAVVCCFSSVTASTGVPDESGTSSSWSFTLSTSSDGLRRLLVVFRRAVVGWRCSCSSVTIPLCASVTVPTCASVTVSPDVPGMRDAPSSGSFPLSAWRDSQRRLLMVLSCVRACSRPSSVTIPTS